ncbi:hypothetical protein LTR17_008049 [Elasticomyces elasticus]|nr:hypothetical protein LTR17_008049 [Elasticomyces elasticus]
MSSKGLFKKKTKAPTAGVSNVQQGSNVVRALGLRKCVEPQDATRLIDVVFVHGLTGDRERTWTDPSSSCFWPQELLPSDLPNARIFTYGYDADVAHFFSAASQSRIKDHANTLLGSLAHVRERSETVGWGSISICSLRLTTVLQSKRPLFFVAHSLGGLVVEDMLLSSKNSAEDHLRNLLESTEGICFMGTPHCGSQLADWGKVITSVAKLVKKVNQPIITVLQSESEVLARIQQEFHTMIRARNDAGEHKLRITCFFEDLDTPGVGTVVPKHSAILSAYNSISIPRDHAGMTKFQDANDIGYQRVSSELWIWARDLNKRLEASLPTATVGHAAVGSPTLAQHPRLLLEDGREVPTNFYHGSMENVGQVFQGSNIGTYNSYSD